MGGKGSFFILLIIVAFLSLSLAVLAGYVFFFGGNSSNTEKATEQHETTKAPKDDELAMISLFEGKKVFNLKSDPESENAISAIQVSIQLKYFKEVPGIEGIEAKMVTYQSEMRELVGNYFLNMTLKDVEKTETKIKAKEDLKKQLNELLLSSEKVRADIIYSVILEDWFYQ